MKEDEAEPSQKLDGGRDKTRGNQSIPVPEGCEEVSAAVQVCTYSPGCSSGASSLELGDREVKQLG